MITRIQIHDFQSIEELDIECGPITVIHGESDTGKSAIVRALYGLAFNSWPTGHVRDGSREPSGVAVMVGDDIMVAATKGLGANDYIVQVGDDANRQDFAKVGTIVPPEAVGELGWRQLELDDGSKFTPNFGMQFDAPFLLTDSPSKRAKVLGTLTNVATLYAAIKEANAWERRAKTRGDAQQEIMDGSAPRIEELERGLTGERVALGELMAVLAAAQGKVMEHDKLEKRWLRMLQVQETVTALNIIIEVMDASDPAEELRGIDRLSTKAEGLAALLANVEFAQERVNSITHELDVLKTTEELETAALAEFEKQNKVCPMCGQDWGHDHGE